MASPQLSERKPVYDDAQILSLKSKKLKEYIRSHSSITDQTLAKLNTINTLRFAAMCCTEWNSDRIHVLPTNYRRLLVEKYKLNSKSKLGNSQIETYINPSNSDSAQIPQIITSILSFINEPKKSETKPETIETKEEIYNDNGNMSSVSSHASMPSLMSDDESDENDDLGSEDSDDSEISMDNISETMENILDSSSHDEKQTNDDRQTQKQNKPKEPPMFENLKGGFLNKPPKPDIREQCKEMGYAYDTIDKALLFLGNAGSDDISQVIDAMERVKEIPIKYGFHLMPSNLNAVKGPKGNIFICIGQRKEKIKLSNCTHLKCTVSLKQRLKKKVPNQVSYSAVLIDLRHISDSKLRDVQRQRLRNGFENVLSFQYSSVKTYILDIQSENERKLSFDEAFKEYKETQSLRKENKNVAKLVTQGYGEKESRKALQMSMNNKETDCEIDCALMNECRFMTNDLFSVMGDADMDSIVSDVYVRISFNNGAKHKIYRIGKTFDYPKTYSFLNKQTSKGLQVFHGNKIKQCKLHKISDEAFTNNEFEHWKNRLRKDHIPLPDMETLDDIIETVRHVQSESLIRNNDLTHLSSDQLLLKQYLETISKGYTCFFCIPSASGNTKYVAFLLYSHKKNSKLLQDSIKFAEKIASECGENDIDHCEIREWILESDLSKHDKAKKGHYKAKGFLFDCNNHACAAQVFNKLSEWYKNKVRQPQHCTNYARLCNEEFGKEYMRIQLMPKCERPKPRKDARKHAQGPIFEYRKGEASISFMAENMSKIMDKVSYEQWTDTNSNFTMDSSQQTHITDSKSNFSDLQSRTTRNSYQSQKKLKRNKPLKNGDRVYFNGDKYEIVELLQGKLIIQNVCGRLQVSENNYHKLQPIH